MEEALNKAIEAGYVNNQGVLYFGQGIPQIILLDPLFWQALGKSLGWKTAIYDGYAGSIPEIKDSWVYYWHRFIDHLAEGRQPEEFFTNLLKK